jgi:hypothetical protein
VTLLDGPDDEPHTAAPVFVNIQKLSDEPVRATTPDVKPGTSVATPPTGQHLTPPVLVSAQASVIPATTLDAFAIPETSSGKLP